MNQLYMSVDMFKKKKQKHVYIYRTCLLMMVCTLWYVFTYDGLHCSLCTVNRLDGSVPVKYGLRLNMDEKYKTLKQELSTLSNIPAEQLLLVEILGPIVKVTNDCNHCCLSIMLPQGV